MEYRLQVGDVVVFPRKDPGATRTIVSIASGIRYRVKGSRHTSLNGNLFTVGHDG